MFSDLICIELLIVFIRSKLHMKLNRFSMKLFINVLNIKLFFNSFLLFCVKIFLKQFNDYFTTNCGHEKK